MVEDNWIRVIDELPKQTRSNRGITVLGQLERGTVLELQFDEGNFYKNGSILDNVIFWQPMPKPRLIK